MSYNPPKTRRPRRNNGDVNRNMMHNDVPAVGVGCWPVEHERFRKKETRIRAAALGVPESLGVTRLTKC